MYLYSPDQDLRFELRIDADTQLPVYTVSFNGKAIIQPSALGLELEGRRLDREDSKRSAQEESF